MQQEQSKILLWGAAICLVITIGSYALFVDRHEGLLLVALYAIMFASYLVLVSKFSDKRFTLTTLGIVLRLVLFVSLPVLSDDFYRFIWDGRLLMHGFNPFEQLPSFYLDKGLDGLDHELFQNLNSPNYFTIYPPVNQFIFWLSALAGENLLVAVTVMRLPIVLADIGILWLINRWNVSEKAGFLYFLNPLVLLELTGNLHFEGVMMFFVILGLFLIRRKKALGGSGALALGIATKLLPLMYLPVMIFKYRWKLALKIWVVTGAICIILFIPLLSIDFITGFTNSLGLYFQKFEFNASIYFLVREIGFWIYGYNQIGVIGPLLGVLTVILILVFTFFVYKRDVSVPAILLGIHTIYLMLATTVHPWYIISLLSLSCLTNSRFAFLWSFLIFFTYLGYSNNGFEQPVLIIWLEYVLVFGMILIELFNLRMKLLSSSSTHSI